MSSSATSFDGGDTAVASARLHWAAAAGVDQSTISRLERGLAPGLRLSRYASMLAVLRAAPYVAEGSPEEPDDLEPADF